jgi:hypothetical protein
MGLDRLVRSAVAVADRVTTTLQGTVQHAAYNGTRDANGKPNRSAAVNRKATVELGTKLVVLRDGKTAVSAARLFFPRPVTVTVDDLFTLPDGKTAPVLEFGGMVDPSTTTAYAVSVTLGPA